MLGKRLKRFRIARGMSLNEFEDAIDHLVSSSTLSKYENGKLQPTAKTLTRMADALGIKSVQLWDEPLCYVEPIAYRKRTKLGIKEQKQIEAFVTEEVEKRVWLQEIMPNKQEPFDLPIHSIKIKNLTDAEEAANTYRHTLNLGIDPIGNLMDILEDHGIYIIEVDASESFDGISVKARDDKDLVIAAAIAVRSTISGDRQRLNLTHELGHLILDIDSNVDTEKAAFRFGAAFLAPAAQLHHDVGTKRNNLHIEELYYLKKRYCLSIQAILHRLNDLQIITNAYYKKWCIEINKRGWRKNEPQKIQPDKPEKFHQQIHYALSEGLISEQDVQRLLNYTLEDSPEKEHNYRRKFLNLPKKEKDKILSKQAEEMIDFYENDTEWREWEGGPVVEHKIT